MWVCYVILELKLCKTIQKAYRRWTQRITPSIFCTLPHTHLFHSIPTYKSHAFLIYPPSVAFCTTLQTMPFFNSLTAKTLKFDNIFCWWGCGPAGTLIHCWWEYTSAQTLWRKIVQHPAKNICIYFDPAIPLLGINLENTKSTSAQGYLLQYCLWFWNIGNNLSAHK